MFCRPTDCFVYAVVSADQQVKLVSPNVCDLNAYKALNEHTRSLLKGIQRFENTIFRVDFNTFSLSMILHVFSCTNNFWFASIVVNELFSLFQDWFKVMIIIIKDHHCGFLRFYYNSCIPVGQSLTCYKNWNVFIFF